MSAIRRIADSNRTSPQVRLVPTGDNRSKESANAGGLHVVFGGRNSLLAHA